MLKRYGGLKNVYGFLVPLIIDFQIHLDRVKCYIYCMSETNISSFQVLMLYLPKPLPALSILGGRNLVTKWRNILDASSCI